MITKDQLDLLKEPIKQNKEMHYTIGGVTERTVHSSLENERVRQLNTGQKAMNMADEKFKNDMAFKSREGFVRAQFKKDAVPEQDRGIAEKTWQQNHIDAHEAGFKRAHENLNQAVAKSFNPDPKLVDTDLGYSVGQPYAPTTAQQLDNFKQVMQNDNSKDLER